MTEALAWLAFAVLMLPGHCAFALALADGDRALAGVLVVGSVAMTAAHMAWGV